jgi:predicted ribosome quality control (RQC) complex YloA/Tae2 family protein
MGNKILHDDHFESKKQMIENRLNTMKMKMEKKKANLEKHKKECEQWEQVKHEGELLKFHFAVIQKRASKAEVHDWISDQIYTLKLDPRKTVNEQMIQRFRRAKKMERGLILLAAQLKILNEKLEELEEQRKQIHSAQNSEELEQVHTALFPVLHCGKNPSNLENIKEKAAIYKRYNSQKGLSILVGKNARANDKLTFQVAKGNDLWMHVRDFPGSHVVIQIGKNNEVDFDSLQDGFQLCLYYSKAKERGEAEVCYTERKHVMKTGTKAGQVQISSHRTAWVRLDSLRINRLLGVG